MISTSTYDPIFGSNLTSETPFTRLKTRITLINLSAQNNQLNIGETMFSEDKRCHQSLLRTNLYIYEMDWIIEKHLHHLLKALKWNIHTSYGVSVEHEIWVRFIYLWPAVKLFTIEEMSWLVHTMKGCRRAGEERPVRSFHLYSIHWLFSG